MNKLFVLIWMTIFQFKAYSHPIVWIKNYSMNYFNLFYYTLDPEGVLEEKDITLDTHEEFKAGASRYVINNNYFIEMKNEKTECSWLQTLSFMHANGWGLKLIINGHDFGIICSNKTSVFDIHHHSELIFSVDQYNNDVLIFKNAGWWQQKKVFPIVKTIFLNCYKRQYSRTQIKNYILTGTLAEK